VIKGGSDLSELVYLEKRRAADIRDMFGKGKGRITDDTKITGFGGGFDFCVVESDRGGEDF
jgi:hypothetical protein